MANSIYQKATSDRIYRGNFRKSLIFATVYVALRENETPMSHNALYEIFKIDSKIGLKGLKVIAPYRNNTKSITPEILINEIMNKLNAKKHDIDEVLDLYEQIKNKSVKLNRSRPNSIASSIIYYWIQKNKKNININEFTKLVNLSKMTIDKIIKDIVEVLEKNERKKRRSKSREERDKSKSSTVSTLDESSFTNEEEYEIIENVDT
jgi:transcription initiation factor TFIIIB Brf1 subunit/transcription initiation factor TFIIB